LDPLTHDIDACISLFAHTSPVVKQQGVLVWIPCRLTTWLLSLAIGSFIHDSASSHAQPSGLSNTSATSWCHVHWLMEGVSLGMTISDCCF